MAVGDETGSITISARVPEGRSKSKRADKPGTVRLYRPGANGANSRASGPYSGLEPVGAVARQLQLTAASVTGTCFWPLTQMRAMLDQPAMRTVRLIRPIQAETGARVGVAVREGVEVIVGGGVVVAEAVGEAVGVAVAVGVVVTTGPEVGLFVAVGEGVAVTV